MDNQEIRDGGEGREHRALRELSGSRLCHVARAHAPGRRGQGAAGDREAGARRPPGIGSVGT